MRVKTAKYNPGNIGSQEGPMDITFSGPLFLHADPVQEKHAVTKQYVDARFGNLDAGDLKTDVLPTSILPAFDGDVNSSQGSNVFTLSNTGVTPGTYTKVTVDLKGRVVSGGSLTNEDIPNLSWSKMVRDKPTTLTGYGITDAVPMSGGTVGSAVKLNGLPSDELHVSNRQYLDNKVEALGSTASPGTVFRFSSDKTPEGFLRCSGGELDKLNYSNLYSVIGDKFTTVDYSYGNGRPWKNQYSFNKKPSSLGAWVSTTTLPGMLVHSQSLVTKNKVYMIGGFNGSSNTGTVYMAPVKEDGTLGAWGTVSSLPFVLNSAQAVVTKNRVYLIGGWDINSVPSKEVYTYYINEDGTLGPWTRNNPLPHDVLYGQALVTNKGIYLIGGVKRDGILFAPVKEDGTLGDWIIDGQLPIALSNSQVIVIKNKVYLLGGVTGSSVINSVYTTIINEDGTLGNWDLYDPLPTAIRYSQSVVVSDKVFLIGGNTHNNVTLGNVIMANIDEDGNVGNWESGPSLPSPLDLCQVFLTKNKIYMFGGHVGGVSYYNRAYVANFSGTTNDYSEYYNGQHYVINNPTKFKLPDHTHLEDQNTYYYIRY